MQNLPQFRLWHIPTQRMYEVQGLLLNFKKAYVTPLTLRTADELPVTVQVDLSDDQSVLMQFTGLVDAHGTPIYEGDVLEVYFDESCISEGEQPYYSRYSVIAKWGSFGIFTGPPYNDFVSFADFKRTDLSSYWICGNMYQLPDWMLVPDNAGIRPDLMIPFGSTKESTV